MQGRFDPEFYKGKRVFVTGHTGFKGSWLCKILANAGAEVTGYSLNPPTNPSLFEIAGIEEEIHSVIGDIRDFEALKAAFDEAQPEIVLHLAAQPIVRDSYKDPHYTYETNVMGTVNLLECVRQSSYVKSVLNVTTDKVYHNNEWVWGYRENEPLDGFDPYSNSKSCSELVTHSYKNSFFTDEKVAVSTARTRPYQHVLEPLAVYLMIAQKQYENPKYQGYYNVGPDDCDCVTTGELVDMFCKHWGPNASWENHAEANAPHEANFLKLDCSKVKATFDWKPRWHIDECMDMICRFSKVWLNGGDVAAEMDKEIKEFMEE